MKKILLVLALLVVGLMSIGIVSADLEALYLTESFTESQTFGTDLYTVDLVDDGGTLKANLNFVTRFPDGTFQQVDAIAASTDGQTLYAIDKLSKWLGRYDVVTDTFTSVAAITNLDNEVVQAAMSPDDKLYVVSQTTDDLCEIVGYNTATPSEGGCVHITGVNVNGADIVFDADGTLYLYSSQSGYRRLYRVNMVTGAATPLGATIDEGFTGLAILDKGLGNIVGSSTQTDNILVLDKTNGAEVDRYRMYKGGASYSYTYGDMTVGALSVGCEDYTTDLIAGGGNPKSAIDVGEVTVSSDGETLEATYSVDVEGWEITETHLDIECAMEDIPQKNGNPIPGKFEFSNDFEPGVTEHTVTVNLDGLCCTDPVIAAHAVVQKETLITSSPYYADFVVNYSQGLKKDGNPVRPGRSVPEQGLAFETGQDETNFFSLGFGGWLIAGFNCPIRNGPGDDVRVIEDTWGAYPLEKAEVYASNDGVNWVYLGLADNTNRYLNIHTITAFDLGSMTEARYIKVVDVTDKAVHNNDADGYDLNAIESLQDCVEIQDETAWAEGPDFPGKNWAMYFSYDLSDCYEPQCSAQASIPVQESSPITGAAISGPAETIWLGLTAITAIIALVVITLASFAKLTKKK